jgi:hypothetical protein
MVTVSEREVTVVVRGFSPSRLERSAARECERELGEQGPWQFTRAEVVPAMVSLGGRVRLYEGRFSASRPRPALDRFVPLAR